MNNSNQLVLRFNQQNFTGNNNENGGPLSVQEHSGNSVAKTTTFSGSLTSTLTSSVINEFRFQFGRDSEPGTANSDVTEARIQTGNGFLQLGRNNFSPRETTIKRWQFIDNISYTRGAHNLKFGADLNFDRIFNFFPGLFSGQYTFNSYALFASNTPVVLHPKFRRRGYFRRHDQSEHQRLWILCAGRLARQSKTDFESGFALRLSETAPTRR